jgi:phosphoribosylanthranilate isomerase
MRTVRVKICGLTRKEDLAFAVTAGADAVGFLVGVPSSPRNLSMEKAKKLISQVPIFVNTVVVTTAMRNEWIVKVCEKLKPSVIQIHGKEQITSLKFHPSTKDLRIIKTIYIKDNILKEIKLKNFKDFDAILFDSYSKRHYGGTGKVHDWSLSKRIKEIIAPVPIILAGGLKPENVKKAIISVEPYAVDVASGVEISPGVKDHKKVKAFIENAKQIKLTKN